MPNRKPHSEKYAHRLKYGDPPSYARFLGVLGEINIIDNSSSLVELFTDIVDNAMKDIMKIFS